MFYKPFVIFGAVFVATAALAQGSLGTITNVDGLVTVTDGATGGTAALGSSIVDGMRFVTTSSGTVTLQFDNGCRLTLQPNQAVTVDERKNCRALVASIEILDGVGVAGGAGLAGGGGGSVGKGILAVGALAAGGFALNRVLMRNAHFSGL